MKTSVKKTIASVLGAAALGLTAMHPAEAARIVGRWDPVFGPMFPDLGWEATAIIDIPDLCLGNADGLYSTASANCSGVQFESVVVDFYDDDDPSQTTLYSKSLATLPVSINNFTIEDNMLTGINAGPFDFFNPGAGALWGDGVYSFSLRLSNVSSNPTVNKARLAYNDLSLSDAPDCFTFEPKNTAVCGISDFSRPGVFTRVPEPQTIALLLAGFAALGFATRRRAQA